MARFVVTNRDWFAVHLQAEDGEEISQEQTLAWAALCMASALEIIASRLDQASTAVPLKPD